jgi:uncharacterized DUF497 family protein
LRLIASDHPKSIMELDLIDAPFDLGSIKPREIEEAFEDPFAIRFLPDSERTDGEARYYALGRTVGNRYLFLAFWTDGKIIRVVAVRDLSEGEQRFYDRKYAEFR